MATPLTETSNARLTKIIGKQKAVPPNQAIPEFGHVRQSGIKNSTAVFGADCLRCTVLDDEELILTLIDAENPQRAIHESHR